MREYSDGANMGKMARALKSVKFRNGDWWFWARDAPPSRILQVCFNFAMCTASMACPFAEIKNEMLNLTGMKVRKNAFIAMGVALDFFYPERIEIGKNAIIGYGCVISAHEMLPGELRIGNVKIGADSLIGTKSVVLPGVEIGDGAKISAMSLVNRDVPANSTWGGIPARNLLKKEK